MLNCTSVMITSCGAGDVKTGGSGGEINRRTKWLSVEPCSCKRTSDTLLCCGSPVNNAGTLSEPHRCNWWEGVESSGSLPTSLHLQSGKEEVFLGLSWRYGCWIFQPSLLLFNNNGHFVKACMNFCTWQWLVGEFPASHKTTWGIWQGYVLH